MSQFTAAMAEFITRGVAQHVGACGPDGRPCISRGLAAQLGADGHLLVVVSGAAAFEVLDAVRATGRVAINFTLAATLEWLQVKAVDAVVVPAGAACRALVEARRAALQRQLVPLGFPPHWTHAWHDVPDDDLVGIRLSPIQVRSQSPGPRAGRLRGMQG